MKRVLLLLPLVLILLAGICAPVTYSGVDEILLQNQFIESADGDYVEYTFAQTITGDVLHYPDAFHNETYGLATAGDEMAGATVSGAYTDTQAAEWNLANYYYGVGGDPPAFWLSLNFTNLTNEEHAYRISYNSYVTGGSESHILTETLSIYDWDASTWDVLSSDLGYGTTTTGNYSEVDVEAAGAEYVAGDCIMLNFSFTSDAYTFFQIDYAAVSGYYMTYADSSHYAESFADVSEWINGNGEGEPTTDGDALSWTLAGDGNSKNFYTNDISMALEGYYVEFSIWTNHTTANQVNGLLYGYPVDDKGGTGEALTGRFYLSTTPQTVKAYISSSTTFECLMWYIRAQTGGAGAIVYIDYLRIAPSNEMGYSYDCSTIDPLVLDGGSGISYTSDSDYLTLEGTASSWVKLMVDTTATACSLSTSYYPFVHISFHADDVGVGDRFALGIADASDSFTLIQSATNIIQQDYYYNIAALKTSLKFLYLYVYDNDVVRWNTVQAYSIANYTITQASLESSDYAYVDGTSLIISIDGGGGEYVQMSHDPVLSISDAYTVYNISGMFTDTTSVDWFFRSCIASTWQTIQYDSPRGETAPDGTSGSLTDFAMAFYGDTSISNIQFIEDATAPSVVRSWANPIDSDDSEQVTLSAVVTDTVEVYTVKMNALVYPAGFSDVDYSMTEQSSNLWKYTFTTMTAGHYTFLITASDGANTNDNTEYAYIDFDVREADISINPITFFGQGSDFTQMQVSFEINKDCDYTIYESSDTDAETDTHTGSISAGWSNIAWDKLDTAETQVDFGIYLTNGSLTAWINGSYSLAQTTFYCEWVETSSSSEQVTVSGYITKSATYTLTDSDGTIQDTGSVDEGDFIITFDIWQSVLYSQQVVYFKLTFTNGTQSTAYEHYFDTPKPLSEYEGKAGGESPDAALDRTRIQFWALFAFVASTGAVVILIYQEYKRRN